ncbi:MAG: hypothetical protein K6E73_09200 [Bacteroidales bacterium]|nr:hypothetical protein [Bacteroidales bacterium]
MPYSDIVKRYWAMFYDGREPSAGNRNTLTFELAMAMRHICGFDEGVLSQVIPNYWASGGGDDGGERMSCIRSALSEPRRGVPFRLRQVLQSLRCERSTSAKRMEETQPPCRPEKLPPLLELLTSRVPEMYKGAVCESVWPSLGVHLHEVQFRYVNNELQEPTFMTVLMAPMSIGKGCVNPPIDYIMADIRQRDDEARRRDREWRESNRRKGANKEKSARPQDICVQWLMADMTNAAFVQRMADAERNGRRFLYSRLDEIEGLNQLRTSSRTDSVSQIIKLAFNCSLYGQERVGAESVNECTHVRWNRNASTTPANGKRFFRNAVNDGTLSRINLTTIMRGESDEMPIYGQYDETFAENLRPYIERLNACSGVIECPQALKLAKTLLEENAERAALCDSEAYRVLSYRANVIAYLKAMVLYVAHGYKWTKQMEQYVRWSEQMDLWCKMHFFGDELENLIGEETKMSGNGQQNLLEALPESFSREEYVQMRQSQGRAGDGSNTLRVWKKRGYIDWDEVVGRYVKLKTCNR